MRWRGPFFFGAVENFERALASTHTDPRVLIIRLGWVPFIDITGLQTLEEVIRDLPRRNVRVLLTGANPRVEAKLKKAGIIELVGGENIVPQFAAALASCGQLAQSDPEMARDRTVVVSETAASIPQTVHDHPAQSTTHRTNGDR